MESLESFMTTLNDNQMGINLTHEASRSKIHFLDLEITSMNGHLETKTFFKTMDRNGYIPTDSCHHTAWLKSIPRSQLMRIRRNCSHLSDYFQQAEMLKSRFCEKGYNTSQINEEIRQVALIEKTSLLTTQPKGPTESKHKWSIQYIQIKEIIRRHWRVLRNDPVLGPLLPERAATIFRGAPSVRGQIAPNVIDPPSTISFFIT